MLMVYGCYAKKTQRKPRIHAPGALHHIIVRGIERQKLFIDDSDHNNFLDRMGGIITETDTER